MRFIALMVIALLSCLPARAQAQAPGSPEAVAAAKELASIMTPDMIGQMTNGMTAQIWPKLEGALRTKVDPAVMAEVRAEFESTLKTFVVEATKDSPSLYAKYFSAQELRDMAAFYRTETGAKALQLMPQVMSDYFATLLPRMEGFNRDLQQRIQAILAKHGVK
jgi:uncharacterized protein